MIYIYIYIYMILSIFSMNIINELYLIHIYIYKYISRNILINRILYFIDMLYI
jgi:hypothetical protein